MTPCSEAAMRPRIELHEGDCLDILPDLDGDSIDLVLADMPYGTTRCRWDTLIALEPMWEQIRRVRKPGAPILLFGAEPFTSVLNASNLREFRYDLIWEKPMATGHLNAKRQPMRAHEHISVFYDKLGTYNPIKTQGHARKTRKISQTETKLYGDHAQMPAYDSTARYPRSVQKWSKDNRYKSGHPSQKPIALLTWLIEAYSNPGDTILDFAAGSGSTGVAARQCNRNCILIEIDPEHCNLARDRMEL